MTPARPRLLIEASKLADEGMDGIKRYVVELLQALRETPLAQRWEIDLLIRDRVVPLAELPAPRAGTAGPAPAAGPGPASAAQRLLRGLDPLVPPILLGPIRWLVPAWAARRFLGKEKSELNVPGAQVSLAVRLLPPALYAALQACLPRRLVLALWERGRLPRRLVLPLWERGWLLRFQRRADPEAYDLVHLTLPNNGHYLGATRTPVLVTVHDLCHLACPEYQTRASNLTLSVGLDRAVEMGASFLAVSEATRQQMLRAYGLDPSRVATVPSGCREGLFHPVFDPGRRAEARRRYGLPEVPFLLTLSTLEPRKNLVGTVRAFEILRAEFGVDDVILVIAGPRGWKSGELMRAVARNRERIHLPGFIDDADLAAIYSSAAGFVYASHYEGFGFPLLEAMRCGAAVVYGDNSSMPELVGDAGLPVDSRDPRAIARQLQRLLREEGLARELGRRALARSKEFTWQRTAADTARVYERRVRGAGAPERQKTGTS